MDTNFNNALQMVLQFEGGFSDIKEDHGGKTNKGIIQTVYDSYRISFGLPVQSVQQISDTEVRDIYYKRYWLVARCDKLPNGVDKVHFDTAVNAGPSQAAKFLQRAIGVKDDGIIGDVTLAKVNTLDPKVVMKAYTNSRISFYIDLVVKDVTQIKFLKGWIKRAISFF